MTKDGRLIYNESFCFIFHTTIGQGLQRLNKSPKEERSLPTQTQTSTSFPSPPSGPGLLSSSTKKIQQPNFPREAKLCAAQRHYRNFLGSCIFSTVLRGTAAPSPPTTIRHLQAPIHPESQPPTALGLACNPLESPLRPSNLTLVSRSFLSFTSGQRSTF